MEDYEKLSETAETEIHLAKKECGECGYDDASRAALWEVFRRWISHPGFDVDFNLLEAMVLNELAFTVGSPELKEEGWAIIADLAGKWGREGNAKRKESLRIASFEIAAEPPELPLTLELLFSLAADPETRRAVFAAYESYPWRLRAHARKYANGTVTDRDCDEWLIEEGHGNDEVLMSSMK